MTIIEIAVKGLERIDVTGFGLQSNVSHYWRVRWWDDGLECDHIELFEDLTGMEQIARSHGGAAWKYYETDVFADAGEKARYQAEYQAQ